MSDLLATIREMRLARFTYAGGLVAGILAGYRLLSLRKDNLGAEEYERRVRAHHVRSAEAIYSGVLRLQGLMIKIGWAGERVIGPTADDWEPARHVPS